MESGTLAELRHLTRTTVTLEADVKAETNLHGGVAYTMFTLDDDPVGDMMTMPDQVPAEVPAYWSGYFAVDDVEATVARTTELGGRVIAPPMEAGGGRFTVLEDPQGALFSLLERAVTE